MRQINWGRFLFKWECTQGSKLRRFFVESFSIAAKPGQINMGRYFNPGSTFKKTRWKDKSGKTIIQKIIFSWQHCKRQVLNLWLLKLRFWTRSKEDKGRTKRPSNNLFWMFSFSTIFSCAFSFSKYSKHLSPKALNSRTQLNIAKFSKTLKQHYKNKSCIFWICFLSKVFKWFSFFTTFKTFKSQIPQF